MELSLPPSATVAVNSSSPSALFLVSTGGGNSQLQRWSSLIGIVTAIVGNILISFALNIQRYAHIRLHKEHVMRKEKSKGALKVLRGGYGIADRNGEEEPSERNSLDDHDPLMDSFDTTDSRLLCTDDDHETEDPTYLKSPYWWGGIVLMTVGEVGNFLAYGFAPASIVSPLGVVALVSNCVIAPILLKETFRQRDFWGVVVAIAGAVTVVLSAKQEEKKLGPHEILDAVTRTEFEVYMGVTILLIGILLWASPRYGKKTILVDLGLVGLFGGYTALSTKGVASMLSSTLWRAFTTPITFVLLAILIGTAIMQVKYVNKALQRFDSTQVIPVQFVLFTLSVIIGSAILFRDFEKATAGTMIKFVGGCLLTFFGVSLITSGRELHDEDEPEQEEVEALERIVLSNDNNYRENSLHLIGSGASKFQESVGKAPVANDHTPVSRRSSHVSFNETVRPPRNPRMYSTSSIRVNTSAPPAPELISATEETPLLPDQWKRSTEELLQTARHPGIKGSTSSPVLPSEAQISGTGSPKPQNNRSSTHENFNTDPTLQRTPQPPQADRPYTPARHSISRMMQGPLLSPLSGGLSVVIADSLRRRGIETPVRSRPIRRARPASKRFVGEGLGESLGTTSPELSDTAVLSQSLQPETTSWLKVTRTRSLSNTLGDLFRGKRQRTYSNADEEVGPSGS